MHDSNKGVAAARNSGIKEANGDILLFINANMEAAPGWVEAHLASHDSKEYIGVTGPVHYSVASGNVFFRYLNRPRRGAKKFAAGDKVTHREFLFWNASIQRDAITAVGGFDERIGSLGGEEMELIYRVENLQLGALIYNPQAVAYRNSAANLLEVCTKLDTFGEKVIPYLVTKHPGLREELGVPLV